ncbi:MAG: YdcF family protein [bacterium]
MRNPDAPPRGLLQRARGCLVSLAVTLAAAAVIGLVAYQLRAPLLTWVGGWLYHADTLEPADAIVVLAGAAGRDLEAADLFAEGFGATILLTRPPDHPAVAALRSRGVEMPSNIETRLHYLQALGVGRTDVTVLQRVVGSTQAEAVLVAEWAESREIERVIVVTSAFHTSRARYVFDQVFRDLDTQILIHPSGGSSFVPATWWQTRANLRNGLFELQKYAYYRLMYLLGRSP